MSWQRLPNAHFIVCVVVLMVTLSKCPFNTISHLILPDLWFTHFLLMKIYLENTFVYNSININRIIKKSIKVFSVLFHFGLKTINRQWNYHIINSFMMITFYVGDLINVLSWMFRREKCTMTHVGVWALRGTFI